MGKKRRISKEELTKRIKPFYPVTTENIKDAFYAINEEPYPETITWIQLHELSQKSDTLEKLVNSILSEKNRKERSDSGYDGYHKRKNGNYKGKERSDIWNILKRAHDLIIG
jgi:hypothetical protein